MSSCRPSLDVNAEEESDWFSFLFLSFLNPLFQYGNKQTVELSDLGKIGDRDRCEILHSSFAEEYKVETQKPVNKQSLWKVLWRCVGYSRLFLGFGLYAMSAAFQFGPINILTRLVRYFQRVDQYSDRELWIMVAFLFICSAIGAFCLAHSNVIFAHIGAQVRNILIDSIYRKSLRLSSYSRQQLSTGHIITIFSEDTNQIRVFILQMCSTIIAPLQIAVCLYFVYGQMGNAMFVGLGYSLFAFPFTGIFFRLVYRLRADKMKFTDMRIKLINEVLSGIRIIKYYAWESAFQKQIADIREQEVQVFIKMAYIFHTVLSLFLIGAPQIQLALIFITFISQGHQLDAAKAFTTLALFGLIFAPYILLPVGLQNFNQARIAMARILKFLDSPEIEPWVTIADAPNEYSLQFLDLSASWNPRIAQSEDNHHSTSLKLKYEKVHGEEENGEENNEFSNRALHTLRNVSISIKPGQLVCIVGSVGSGKSSLLSCLLGEIYCSHGSLILSPSSTTGGPPSIAYCDQRAWIINASVKENIMFGKPWDEKRMNDALNAACMNDDLKLLSDGIDTEIGERGINLSGGQKARVSLARAVYNDADIYLLDDPLSAVDAHVGRHIFEHCILGTLCNKTRLMVTNQLHILPNCDLLVVLNDNGTVKAVGPYAEVTASGIDITAVIQPNGDHEPESEDDEALDTQQQLMNPSHKPEDVDTFKPPSSTSALMTIEEHNDGSVEWSTYWKYIQEGGTILFALNVFIQLCSQVLLVYSNFWLSDWGEETTIDNYYYRRDMTHSRAMYWYHGYVGLQISGVFCFTMSRAIYIYHRSQPLRSIHDDLLNTVLKLPVSFFDVTPVGRVINRFSYDMSIADDELPLQVMQLLTTGVSCLGYFGAMAGSTKGILLGLAVPVVGLYYRFQSFFRKTNTAVARLESISRSPIYADFSQTLYGTQTVRAYLQQDRFIRTLEDYANANTVPSVMQQIAGQWLALRLDILGALIMCFMGALTVGLKDNDLIPAKYLGLGLAYSIQLNAILKIFVRAIAQVEALFNSIERIQQYTNMTTVTETNSKAIESNMDAPGDVDIEMNTVVKSLDLTNWPTQGRIVFDDVHMRYREGPLVLKSVCFEAQPKDKIGIAGRTGCGKSSLMVALFRIEELCQGRILIDDIDIATVPLSVLRSKLCIIPQDPVMFSATVHFNLDPFKNHTKDELIEVLESVNMWKHVQSLPNGLDEMVSEGGDNFSAGQRQVICCIQSS